MEANIITISMVVIVAIIIAASGLYQNVREFITSKANVKS